MNQVIVDNIIFAPPAMLEFIKDKIQAQKNSVLFKFDYRDLFKHISDYDYRHADILKQNMRRYFGRGSLYIFTGSYEFKLYINAFSRIFGQNIAISLYDSMHSTFGLTKYGITNIIDGTQKNCLIILNGSLLNTIDWAGTLQHQLTHFIQRFIGLQNTIDSGQNNIIDNILSQNQIYRYCMKLALMTGVEDRQKIAKVLTEKYMSMFAKNQIQQTVQSLIWMFWLFCSKKIEFKNREINSVSQFQNKTALKNLDILLENLNSEEYLSSDEFRNLLDLYQKPSVACDEEQRFLHRKISYMIIYLGIKNMIPQIKIDEKLIGYFEENKNEKEN